MYFVAWIYLAFNYLSTVFPFFWSGGGYNEQQFYFIELCLLDTRHGSAAMTSQDLLEDIICNVARNIVRFVLFFSSAISCKFGNISGSLIAFMWKKVSEHCIHTIIHYLSPSLGSKIEKIYFIYFDNSSTKKYIKSYQAKNKVIKYQHWSTSK